MDSEKTVIICGLAAGGLKLAADWPKTGGTPEWVRGLVGTALLTAILLLTANFAPPLATGLALAVLVTSVAMNGQALFKIITSLI